MRTPIPDYLQLVLNYCSQDNPGETAQYIPELADADPDRCALVLSTVDGEVYGVGDTDVEFSMQSISKAFVYALALEEHGIDYVVSRVGVEPSGEAFNELSLEHDTRRPLNPMINAGAITMHTMVGPPGISAEERFERILSGMSAFAGRDLSVDEAVYESEMETAYRNLAIANMLRNYRVIQDRPLDVVRGYVRQCAIKVTTRDLALMAATLANSGVQPITGEQVISPDNVRQTLSVMMSCGMYDGAGDWMSTVGFPAKSGVGGGLIGSLPGQVGIATFSPRLDKHGSSLRGVRMCKRLSDDMGLHIMSAPAPAHSVVRRYYLLRAPPFNAVQAIDIAGTIRFTSAERVLRVLTERSDETIASKYTFVLDFRSVYHLDKVARRMLREAISRLRAQSFKVVIVDPGCLLEMISVEDVVESRLLELEVSMLPANREEGDDGDAGGDGDNTTKTNGHVNGKTKSSNIVDDIVDDLAMFETWERVETPNSMRRLGPRPSFGQYDAQSPQRSFKRWMNDEPY
ncbi:hypothetical protein VHUM_04375 [Vanrija humicola]|uniref:glutaminase n=1 Tax=Vanrija humicola TaxID=5417 RepID=A0A7D8UWW4_VANHU|nr:hypothetical protein VHUM_04375 [Vanrija humicola]